MKKKTKKYIFRIEEISYRKATWEDSHGMNYMMNKTQEGDLIREDIYIGEVEVTPEFIIGFLSGLRKDNDR